MIRIIALIIFRVLTLILSTILNFVFFITTRVEIPKNSFTVLVTFLFIKE